MSFSNQNFFTRSDVGRTKSVFALEYSCSKAKKLAEYIYVNSNIYLERKHLTYKNNVLEVKENGK